MQLVRGHWIHQVAQIGKYITVYSHTTVEYKEPLLLHLDIAIALLYKS